MADLGVPIIATTMVSTSCGLLFSCFAAPRFTFNLGRCHDLRGVLLFVAVTGTGFWLVQPRIPVGVMALLPAAIPVALAAGFGKIAGIAVDVTCNRLLYKRVVFHNH